MPELPEVESIVRCLSASIKGQRVSKVAVHRPDILANTDREHLCKHLQRQSLQGICRRGKYIVMEFGNGCRLVSHLRMSGLYRFLGKDEDVPYLRLWFELENGCRLGYIDKRALGRIWLYLPGEELAVLSGLGPEPLDQKFTLKLFRHLSGKYKRPIKPLLLDQNFIAGIGNIYASEILCRAGIAPARQSGSLTPNETSRLYKVIRGVLRQAIIHKGTHISDYDTPDGGGGRFVNLLKVYRKAGEICPRCGNTIQRIVQQQRSTYWCPGCQL